MAMVISTRAKLLITALIAFFLLGIVLVTGSTKGWFLPNRYNGERVAARIQVINFSILTFIKISQTMGKKKETNSLTKRSKGERGRERK